MTDSSKKITIEDLPMTFQAKYLGSCKAAAAWGLQHVRKPVDLLIETAKSERRNLSPVEITVIVSGVEVTQLIKDKEKVTVSYNIEHITYGVQDVEYRRVFCIIITKPDSQSSEEHMLHAFLCPSKKIARDVTFALGSTFKHLAETIKSKAEEARLKQVIQLKCKQGEEDDDSEADA